MQKNTISIKEIIFVGLVGTVTLMILVSFYQGLNFI